MEKSERKHDLIGKLLIFSATLVWGSSFVILKDTLSELGNGHFTFFVLSLRFVIASVIFAAFCVKRFSKFNKRVLLDGIALGGILFLAYAFQTVALNYTTPSKNAFLTEVYCVLVPFLSWFLFKKKPSAKNFVAAFVCLAGVVIIAFFGKTEKASNEALGDGLTVFCGLFYALQMIFISFFNERDDSMLLLFVEISTVAVLCLATSAIWEFPRHADELVMSGEAVWKIVYLGVLATGYAQFAQMYGQKFTSATTTSIIMCFEGVFGVVFEFIFGQNNLNTFIIIGFSLIFLTLIINETDIGAMCRKIEERKKRAAETKSDGATSDITPQEKSQEEKANDEEK